MVASLLDLPSLSLLVVVVLVSCILATLLSWCWVRSTSPRTFLYCSTCAQQMGVWTGPQAVITDGIGARPWVEVAQGGGALQNQLPHGHDHSGTFQRLGMKPGTGLLKVEQLETRPLSPVPGECETNENLVRNSQGKTSKLKQILSPTSADVLARKDSVRSRVLGSRMSRRTLEFPTQSQKSLLSHNSKNKSHTGPVKDSLDKSSSLTSLPFDIDTDNNNHDDASANVQRVASGCNDTRQKQVRRSVSARKEKSRYMVIKRQEEAGFTSQSEDDLGARKPRQARRHQTGSVDSEALRVVRQQQADGAVGGYSNQAFVQTTDPSNERASVINSSSVPQELQQFSSNVSPVNPGYENLPSIQFPLSTTIGPPRD